MNPIKLAFCIAMFLSLAIPAMASPLDDAAPDAADGLKAYQAKVQELDDVWDKMPLAAQTVLFADGPVSTYGAYDVRANNEYKNTEKVVSYIEPVGITFKDLGGGIVGYGFKIDLKILKEDGSTLFQKDNYVTLDTKARSRKRELEFNSELGITGIADGTYTIEFLFHDLNSDKTMTVTQVFKVVS